MVCYRIIFVTFWLILSNSHFQCSSKDTENVSVNLFGAKGDGVTDDSEAFRKALLYCIQSNKILYVPKTEHYYNIKSTIRVNLNQSDCIRIISNHATIKPTGNLKNLSAYNLTAFREHIFISIGRKFDTIHDDKDIAFNAKTVIEIKGLNLDGSFMKSRRNYKLFDNDIFIGMQLIAEKILVDDCLLTNLEGYGIRCHEFKDLIIRNSKFIEVGGRGNTLYANKMDSDGFGDGIYIAKINKNAAVSISNCQLKGYKGHGFRSRSGITFEYSTQPYTASLNNLTIKGYAKCLHVEEPAISRFYLNHVKMDDFNFGIANVLNNQSKIYLNQCIINVGHNDGKDNGDALAFLNYLSNAMIFVDHSTLNFNGRQHAYQSAVGLKQVKRSTINAYKTNFFFADGSTKFEQCTFVDFGGAQKSFSSNKKDDVYEITNSKFNKSAISDIWSEQVKLIINAKSIK